MNFPQYSKLIRTYLLGDIFLTVAWLLCMVSILPSGDYVEASIVTAVVAINWVATIFCRKAEKKKVICIDETGISLTVKGKEEWAFSWEEIESVHYGSAMRYRSVYFLPKEPPKQDLWTISSPYRFEFHLCRAAKEALAQYCPLPIQR